MISRDGCNLLIKIAQTDQEDFNKMIHNFSEYLELLNEGFIVKNGTVFFDPTSSNFVNTKFGKTKFKKPYEKKLPFGSLYTVYRSSGKGEGYGEILRAIKKTSSKYTIDDESYRKFINRTSIFMSKIIINENIDTIILMETSSSILRDISTEMNRRLPGYYDRLTYDRAIFKNPDISSIDINREYNIDDRTRKSMERILDKARKDKYFSIKKINPPYLRKMLTDWLSLNNDVLSKIIDRNVAVIDDFVTSGETMNEASRLVKEAGASNMVGIAVVKGASHR